MIRFNTQNTLLRSTNQSAANGIKFGDKKEWWKYDSDSDKHEKGMQKVKEYESAANSASNEEEARVLRAKAHSLRSRLGYLD